MHNIFTLELDGNAWGKEIKAAAYDLLLENILNEYGETLPEGGNAYNIAHDHTQRIRYLNNEYAEEAVYSKAWAERMTMRDRGYDLTACRYWTGMGKRYEANVNKYIEVENRYEYLVARFDEGKITAQERKELIKVRKQKIDLFDKINKALDNKKKTLSEDTKILIRVAFHS